MTYFSQAYLAKQALENPHIKRVGFLKLRDVETLTGVAYETLRKHVKMDKLVPLSPSGPPRFDIVEVYAYLIRIKFILNPVDAEARGLVADDGEPITGERVIKIS